MARTRRKSPYQDDVVIQHDHGAITQDTEVKLYLCPAGKTFQVTKVDYVNPTGLATDAANYFTLSVRQGAVVVAGPRTTNSAGGSALTADAWNALTLSSTAADLLIEAGETLSFLMDETGTQTLPAGRVVIHGRYI